MGGVIQNIAKGVWITNSAAKQSERREKGTRRGDT